MAATHSRYKPVSQCLGSPPLPTTHVPDQRTGQTVEQGTDDSPPAPEDRLPPGVGAQSDRDTALTLVKMKSRWLHGDWSGLAQLAPQDIAGAPGRALMALMIGSAHAQLGGLEQAAEFFERGRRWGCDKEQLAQVLVAGVHNSLARAFALRRDDQALKRHFAHAIAPFAGDRDRDLLSLARSSRELMRMGLLPQAAELLGGELADVQAGSERLARLAARVRILESEFGLLQYELSIAQQRRQLYQAAPEAPSAEGDREAIARRSVSQLGQDSWVLERTGYKRNGFFVEFGATDGVLLSNTLLLESEFAWTGICAEPNPELFRRLRENRRCTLSNQCIGGSTGEAVEFVLADAYGGVLKYAYDDGHADKRDAYRKAGRIVTLTTVSLDDFLKQHGAPHDIDYLSIDTEGSELEILETFPFENWNIRLLTIEHNFTSRRAEIRSLMERHGYRCTEAGIDDWYEKAD